jgi:hypothetical protein
MQKAFLQKVGFYRMELQARLPGHSIRAGRSSMAVLAHEVEGDADEGTYEEDGKGQEHKIVSRRSKPELQPAKRLQRDER